MPPTADETYAVGANQISSGPSFFRLFCVLSGVIAISFFAIGYFATSEMLSTATGPLENETRPEVPFDNPVVASSPTPSPTGDLSPIQWEEVGMFDDKVIVELPAGYEKEEGALGSDYLRYRVIRGSKRYRVSTWRLATPLAQLSEPEVRSTAERVARDLFPSAAPGPLQATSEGFPVLRVTGPGKEGEAIEARIILGNTRGIVISVARPSHEALDSDADRFLNSLRIKVHAAKRY